MTKPTFGSLFAGVGGIDLGFEAAGWEGKFQVEWDPHCQQTLAHHWPDVPRWGDVSDVSGAELPPVDLITFGSPCQDLSTAGKRAGLVEGSRSNLFFQATRIIKEMRDATGNSFPRWALWENVPGAFSSNQGADFGAVLDEMANLGAVAIEWHCLDAQFFGVPQRRRRVFVLACFDSGITKRGRQQVLPVPEGRRGDSATRRQARQDAARAAEKSARGTRGEDAKGWDSDGTGIVGCLAATDYKGIRNQTFDENKVILEFAPETEVIPFAEGTFGTYREGVATLRAKSGTVGGGSETLLVSEVPEPVAFQPGEVLRRDQSLSDVVPTLRAQAKSGDNEPHVLVPEEASVYVKGRRAHSVDDYETWDESEVAPTLNQGDNRSESRSTVLILDGTRVGEVRLYEEPVQTLISRMGTGGNNVPMVVTEAPLPVLMRQREGKAGGGKGPLLSTDLSPSLVGSNELVLFAPAEVPEEPLIDEDRPVLAWEIGFGFNSRVREELAPTLRAGQDGAHIAIPIQDGREIEKHQNGLGIGEEGDPSYTLDQTGGQAVAQEVVIFEPGALSRGLSGDRWSNDTAMTLRANMGDNQPAIVYPIQGTIVGRSETSGPQGLGVGEPGDPMYTLDLVSQHHVAQEVYAFPSTFSNNTVSDETFPTLTVGSSVGISSPPAVAYPEEMTLPISHAALRGGGVALTPSPDSNGGESLRHPGFGLGEEGDPMYSLTTTPPAVATTEKEQDMTDTPHPRLVVRRLTPIECERLMGWPDNHTLYRADGKMNSDSTRYKMCGNGVASPVAEWIARHILKAQQKMDADRSPE